MNNVNKVTLIGRLGSNPVIRTMSSGDKVANMRIASSDSWKNKVTGERQETTEWHNIVIYNENIVRVAEQYLKSGALVYLEGALRTREWTDEATGNTRYTTEIVMQKYRGELVMLDKRSDNSGGIEMTSTRIERDLNEEIPF